MPQFYDRSGVLRDGDINAQIAADHARWLADARQRQSGAWRRKAFRTAAGGAALFGGGALLSSILAPSAVGAGAGAAGGSAAGGASAAGSAGTAAGWTMPGVTAPTFGAPAVATTAPSWIAPATASRLTRLGSILNSPGMQLGVGAGLNLIGMRAQNKANAQARADALRSQQQAIELQLKEIEERRRSTDLDRDEARRLNEQAHALQVRQIQLAEEDRNYRRELDARDEARLAPYRRISEQAARQLASIWGLG